MPIMDEEGRKKKAVKTADGLDLTTETKVRVLQRDLAPIWPSADKGAENINVFQDHLTNLLDEGWEIEEMRFFERRAAGELEWVYPIALLMIFPEASE